MVGGASDRDPTNPVPTESRNVSGGSKDWARGHGGFDSNLTTLSSGRRIDENAGPTAARISNFLAP